MSGTNLTDGNDTFTGGGEIFALMGNDSVTGLNNSNDTIYGGAGNDTLSGLTGEDLLRGGLGDDSLLGGGGEDTLRGGEGADIIVGGANADSVFGGAGADSFVYFNVAEGFDLIADFETADQIVVSAAGFGGGLVAGGAAAFVSVNAFGGDVEGQATVATGQFIFDADVGNLWWDVDGTGSALALLVATVESDTNVAAAVTAADITVIG